ncbi:MAG: excinuclease ABC subunit UvrA [bacterium]
MSDYLIVKGARVHNLKNVNLTLPKHKLIVFTGLSGSGKSSLAFDTIFAEGQRRYIESLSAFARQFLNQLDKPDVDSIDGLSPAISIDQKSATHNPRSTVGTVTEIYDYFRLLFSSIGRLYCYGCGQPIEKMDVQAMVDRVFSWPVDSQVMVLAPLVISRKGAFKDLFERLRKSGFVRVRVDGELFRLDDDIVLDQQCKHDIYLIVDRISLIQENMSRLFQSVEVALRQSKGSVRFENVTTNAVFLFSEQFSCSACELSFSELSPRLFSFNSPLGACSSCNGLGSHLDFDSALVFPFVDKPLRFSTSKVINLDRSQYGRQLERAAASYDFDLDTIFEDLTEIQQNILFYGQEDALLDNPYQSKQQCEDVDVYEWEGVINILRRRLFQTRSEGMRFFFRSFMSSKSCAACSGQRLNPSALSVRVKDKNIFELCALTIKDLLCFFENGEFNKDELKIAVQVLKEIRDRLTFLDQVGLGYLSLSRRSSTLSGGEFQRIRLATQIGSGLSGVLYVLDEPSIGLHQRDNQKLLKVLRRLKDLGNTLIVVEHDEDTIQEADYVVDIGPFAGCQGGEIVFSGTKTMFLKDNKSLTARFVRGLDKIDLPKAYRPINKERCLTIEGCTENNLKNISVSFPLGCFISVTGVSGSGKSTLIYTILYRVLMRHFYGSKQRPGHFRSIKGMQYIDKVITIDQSPIGRTPRSNPVTYTGVFSDIRDLFARTKEARVRGYKSGRFSFNVKGGRCEACSGDGVKKIEMHFLSDVYITCDVCQGARYNRETLEVLYKGKTISDVLLMTVNQALEFFSSIPSIYRNLTVLQEVGLGYIHLGQRATTLSGGEAQRVKLAKELARRSTGRTLYLLDEPTTGLHFLDIKNLLMVLQRLVHSGNTVIVVEHNLHVVKVSDYVIDLGPEGGDQGGEIVAEGSPKEISLMLNSHTGHFLKPLLE